MQVKVDGFIKDVAGSLKNYKIVLATIKRIFKYAVALNLIKYNPMDRVLIRTVKREVDERKVKHYDKAEVKKLLEGLSNLDTDSWRDTLFSTFSKLLLYTGLRAGEALALEWSDIDFKDNMLSVSKTLYITGEISDTPKSLKSIRMIEIDDDTIEMLKEWKKFQLLKCWGLDVNAQPKIVFYNFQSKNHYRYTTLRTKSIEFANDVGLPYLNGFHCLRHTHATMCVNAGMDYKILQERLGHEEISMTMNIYAIR